MNATKGFSLLMLILMVAILSGAGFYLYQGNDLKVENKENTSSDEKFPFRISALKVGKETVSIDDGDPQTLDGDFKVVWDTEGGETLDATKVILNFGLVDETGDVVIPKMYGGGVDATFRDGERTLTMSPLCSTIPVESCIEDGQILPDTKYRLKAVGWVCSDPELNAWYCEEKFKEYIEPVYSNWFTISL